MARWLLALLCLGIAASAGASATLPVAVAQALATADIPPSAVALVVQPVPAGKTGDAVPAGLTFNAGQAMNPASTMKLLTTLAALERLGPDYRWRTEAYLDGPLRNGVLYGDLILRGGGDPFLSWDRLAGLLRQLRARGLREVRGDLLLDRSFFAPQNHDPTAFDGRPQRPYNVGADALLLNFGALTLTLRPAREGVAVIVEPPLHGVQIDNRLRASAGECGDWREALDGRFERSAEGWSLRLAGNLPFNCGEKTWHLAGLPADDFFAAVFAALWRELGGTWAGKVRAAPLPAGARLFATVESPPLADIVRETNKFSNNVMARHLLLTLGREHCACPAQPTDGAAALRAWAAAQGLALPELVLENGAGLSRRERLSAAALAALLRHGWRSARMPEFIASLPVVGVDGTLRRRLRDEGVSGQGHLKTGLLEDVRALAGYVLDRHGQRWIVVLLINDPQAARAATVQEALLRWVWQGADATPP